MAKHGVFDATRVQLPYWYFLGEAYFESPNNQAVIVPSEATIFEIDAQTAAVYYAINNPICSTFSHGYIAQNTSRTLGPLSNLNTLRVHAPGAIVHITFFKEV